MEAGRIEQLEAGLDRMIARDEKNGISRTEQAQISQRENAISRQIERDRSNAVRGNPASASNQRMQADVQRNINQDRRIEAGVKSGQLSPGQTADLEHGQARVDRTDASAARDGNVSAAEKDSCATRREPPEPTDRPQQAPGLMYLLCSQGSPLPHWRGPGDRRGDRIRPAAPGG
ncbi:MAG: hypothetical protein NVS2B4_00210 [Ramlibacter sp.]